MPCEGKPHPSILLAAAAAFAGSFVLVLDCVAGGHMDNIPEELGEDP